MSLKTGHRIVPVIGEEYQQQKRDFKAYNAGLVRLQPNSWFFTAPFISYAEKIYNFKFRPTDVLIMTYPKCGTTWTQEIAWTLVNNPDLNHPLGHLPVNARVPFLEADFIMSYANAPPNEPGNVIYDMFKGMYPDKNVNDGIFYQLAQFSPDPRLLKTHLPLSLFSPSLLHTCKVVYVARNPKDVAVSYNHHSKLVKAHDYVGSFDNFIDHFINDTLIYSPYWTNMKEAWDKRSHPNMHFIFYEDLKDNPKAEIIRLQKFLGTKLTDKQIDNVVKYTSFPVMKVREAMFGEEQEKKQEEQAKKPEENAIMNLDVLKEDGGFFRKGISGDWKNKMTDEQARKIDEWTKKNVQDFGPDFKYFQ